jgi:hypothetical protein
MMITPRVFMPWSVVSTFLALLFDSAKKCVNGFSATGASIVKLVTEDYGAEILS